MMPIAIPVVVVGAGPAGLATSHELRRRRIEHVVLERGSSVGHCWKHLYESLELNTGKHMSALPGLRFGKDVPLFPTRAQLCAYLDEYARRFELPVRTSTTVSSVERDGARWKIVTDHQVYSARAVVVATGIISNPAVADVPGRDVFQGRVFHTVDYRRAEDFTGRRVLVVGFGASAADIASDVSRVAARVDISLRSSNEVLPKVLYGVPTQYVIWAGQVLKSIVPAFVFTALTWLFDRSADASTARPRALPPAPKGVKKLPVLGTRIVELTDSGVVPVRAGIVELTSAGARFSDGTSVEYDDVILATGFRPALSFLKEAIRHDERGFAVCIDRVTSDHAGLYFVGHNTEPPAGLLRIAEDAPRAAKQIAKSLAKTPS